MIDNFILNHKTIFDMTENKEKAIKNGQNEVCTAKKGLRNSLRECRNIT